MQPTALITLRQKEAYRLILGLIVELIVSLIAGLIYGLTYGLSVGLSVGLFHGLFYGLIYGQLAGLFYSRTVALDTIEPVEEISISMSREARWEILRSLRPWLIFGLICGLIFGLIYGLAFGLIYGLIYGLIAGLIFGLIFGLIAGLKADIQTRIEPNQGIKNSVKNMVIVTTIALVMALPFNLLLKYLFASVADSAVLPRIGGFLLSILIWSSFDQAGGRALIQHLALRLVLAWDRYAPLRYDLLLNYCTERLLLQRIGGRYRFMHKLLQDHFAKMEFEVKGDDEEPESCDRI
jgi:hypothetical protein